MTADKVYVKDYTSPGDTDSALGIRNAIEYAIAHGIKTVVFDEGRYMLKSFIRVATEGMRHDAGCHERELFKDCHIPVLNVDGLSLIGQTDKNGESSTILVGDNPVLDNVFLPSVLWCENNTNLTIKNIAFTRYPEFASAGEVIRVSGASAWIEVFEGNPYYDGMDIYCANRFTKNRDLIGESVTYGQPIDVKFKSEGGRILRLDCEYIAKQLNVGELLSWHQGAQTDFQVCFRHCDNLGLENLRTYNSNGFCMMAEDCHGIKADKVVFEPDGNRLFTGPRDAWKLFKCGGVIEINGMYIEGVRMDGQNIQNTWFFMTEKLAPNEAVFFCLHTYCEIKKGSIAEFYRGSDKMCLEITDSENMGWQEKGYLYRLKFAESIPDFADGNTFVTAQCYRPEVYICKNSTFKNIAGAGQIVKTSGAYIKNCRYINTMNPGILIGSELTVHNEGVHGTDIFIDSCEFDNCGFFPRYDSYGCIGIKSAGFHGNVNNNIFITDCTFKNAKTGVNVQTCGKAVICDCKFENIKNQTETDCASKVIVR